MALSCIAFDPLMFGENFCWRCGKYQYGSSWDTSMIKTIIESGQLGIFFLFRLWYDVLLLSLTVIVKERKYFPTTSLTFISVFSRNAMFSCFSCGYLRGTSVGNQHHYHL
jgi:hypothetical protein